MSGAPTGIDDSIELYLRTGHTDPYRELCLAGSSNGRSGPVAPFGWRWCVRSGVSQRQGSATDARP